MSDVTGMSKVRIKPLQGAENYATWIIFVKELLRREDLITHIESDIPSGAPDSEAAQEWRKQDQRARSHIVLHLGDQAVTNVTATLAEDATAKVVWDRLKSIYQKDNLQAVLNTQAKLFQVSFKDGEDIDKHFLLFEDLFVQLSSLGSPISEKEKIGHLLRSLPKSLSHLTSMAGHMDLSYDDLRASVRSDIERNKSGEASSSQPETPAGPSMGARKAAFNSNKNVECFYCGKRGHYIRDCRKKRSEQKIGRGGRRNFQRDDRDNRSYRNNRGNSNRQSSYGRPTPARDDPPPGPSSNHQDGRYDYDDRSGGNNSWDNRNLMTRWSALAVAAEPKTNKTWLDSGANVSCVWDRALFTKYKPTKNDFVKICEGKSSIEGVGLIRLPIGDAVLEISAKHVPGFHENIVAASQIAKSYRIILEDQVDFKGLILQDYASEKNVLQRTSIDGMYPIPAPVKGPISFKVKSARIDVKKWHDILGHPGRDRLLAACKSNIGLPQFSWTEVSNIHCTACMEAASKRAPVHEVIREGQLPLSLTHTDIAGPIDPMSLTNKKYVVVFLDDFSRMSMVYFLKARSEFFQALVSYRALVENEQTRRMYRIRLDRAGENMSTAVAEFTSKNGILLEYSPAHAKESNGSAERLIQELWKIARTLLFDSRLPHALWTEAVSHANWLRNRTPSGAIDMKIPFEVWYNRKPSLSTVISFGQKGYAFEYKSETAKQKKLLPRSLFGFFVGMESTERLFRIFIPSKNKVVPCRSEDFKLVSEQLPSFNSLLENLSIHRQEAEAEGKDDESEKISLQMENCAYSAIAGSATVFKSKKIDRRLPKSFDEACRDKDWAESIDREFDALVRRNTWRLIPFEKGMQPIPFTWQFKLKESPGTAVPVLHKARCCLRGDKQQAFVDYDPNNLYAPVARHETIRMFLAKVAAQNLLLEGADISNAYLYGDLDQPVLMHQPTNSSRKMKPNHVALVSKSIYGHRSAGQIWGDLFDKTISSWGFMQSKQDARLHFYRRGKEFMLMAVVVDDIAMATNSHDMMKWAKERLSSTFQVKLLGQLQGFIGWQLKYTAEGILLHQSHYIGNLINDMNLNHAKPTPTPLSTSADFSEIKDNERPLPLLEHNKYRSLVGALLYAAVCTRPDISFATGVLARQVHAPTHRHFVLAKRVVRYLAGTASLSIIYPRTSPSSPMEAFCDADWAGCRDTRKSTTGVLVNINQSPIMWTSKRQTLVSLSSSEAEYIAVAHCARIMVWIRRLYSEMIAVHPCAEALNLPPTTIRTDNTAAISLAKQTHISERSKHIDIRIHYVRDLVMNGTVTLHHIRTYNQLADILTKPLSQSIFTKMRDAFMILHDKLS